MSADSADFRRWERKGNRRSLHFFSISSICAICGHFPTSVGSLIDPARSTSAVPLLVEPPATLALPPLVLEPWTLDLPWCLSPQVRRTSTVSDCPRDPCKRPKSFCSVPPPPSLTASGTIRSRPVCASSTSRWRTRLFFTRILRRSSPWVGASLQRFLSGRSSACSSRWSPNRQAVRRCPSPVCLLPIRKTRFPAPAGAAEFSPGRKPRGKAPFARSPGRGVRKNAWVFLAGARPPFRRFAAAPQPLGKGAGRGSRRPRSRYSVRPLRPGMNPGIFAAVRNKETSRAEMLAQASPS